MKNVEIKIKKLEGQLSIKKKERKYRISNQVNVKESKNDVISYNLWELVSYFYCF